MGEAVVKPKAVAHLKDNLKGVMEKCDGYAVVVIDEAQKARPDVLDGTPR